MGGWPAPGNAGPTTHRGIAYQYRSSFGLGFNEPANLRIDDPSGTAISADYWCVREVRYGVTYGHGSNGKWASGYATAYLDGGARWLPDRYYYMIANQPWAGFGAGSTINNGKWDILEGHWQAFFDQ
jgi:hypothetical protein